MVGTSAVVADAAGAFADDGRAAARGAPAISCRGEIPATIVAIPSRGLSRYET
ncbi:hypothetical protein OCAR_4111 [Afipia carboxidovorans OM5]|nr:hypothetical protein OCAR_4111 [Afipia carboxidovorans OM5]